MIQDNNLTLAAPAPRPGLPWRMIQVVMRGVSRVAPGLKPSLQTGLIRAGYGLVSKGIGRKADITFMNFGYAPVPDSDGRLELAAEDRENQYAIQLYHRVVGGSDLHGKDVLEVGSGRGGGSSYIMRHLGPRSVTGVDFAATAVRFCRRRHDVPGLTFVEGNAESLPFPPHSFDVVVNVESSHCYPSVDRFLEEVARVLRPGGQLLFADLRPHDKVSALRDQVARRFEIVEEECITPQVFRALELNSEHRSAFIDGKAPALLRRPLRNFSAVKGTATYEAFRRRELEYVRFVGRKRELDDRKAS